MRLLIYAALIYLAWRAFRSWTSKSAIGRRPTGDPNENAVDDVMVKDPQCGVYFARQDGVHLRLGGEDHYFCSAECRDRYLDAQKDGE